MSVVRAALPSADMRRPRALLVLVLAAGAVAGGCSSGPDPAPTPTTRPRPTSTSIVRAATRTKAEIVAQGDAICAASREAIAAIPDPESAADLGPAVERLLVVRRDQIRQLDELGPPTTEADAWADVLRRFVTAADTLEAKLPAIEQNPEVVTSDPQIVADNEAAAAAAAAFGLTRCGAGPAAGPVDSSDPAGPDPSSSDVAPSTTAG